MRPVVSLEAFATIPESVEATIAAAITRIHRRLLKTRATASATRHPAINGGQPGVLHGNMTYLLQDAQGQITEAHSISAGLDYPGIGPEHSWLHDVGRAKYLTATDAESLDAFKLCAELEGILPAIESAHALARLPQVAKEVGKGGIVVLNLSGRGDKDVATVAAHLGRSI